MNFPIILRGTTYVAPKPPKLAQKRKMAVFYLKLNFTGRKSATKFLCVNTVSNKVLWHSIAYLTVHKWLVVTVDIPFYMNIWPKLTHLFKNTNFQLIFACSTSAVSPSKKVHLT